MGITPIVNLNPLPVAPIIERDLEPLPMERVENSARTGDETYSPGNQQSAGKKQHADEDATYEDDTWEDEDMIVAFEDEVQAVPPPATGDRVFQISYFA
jgi:hypothetical protein